MNRTDYEIATAMQTYGGSFIKALAAAFMVADPVNQAKLKGAFHEYWREYRDLVALQKRQHPRQKGDDDGIEYPHPADANRERFED